MTLPVDLLQRRAGPDRYDAVVVGAGVAGLVCAAVLARGGARTLLVESAKRPGGQLQTVAHQGYAVDTGPLFWDALGFSEVLAAVRGERGGALVAARARRAAAGGGARGRQHVRSAAHSGAGGRHLAVHAGRGAHPVRRTAAGVREPRRGLPGAGGRERRAARELARDVARRLAARARARAGDRGGGQAQRRSHGRARTRARLAGLPRAARALARVAEGARADGCRRRAGGGRARRRSGPGRCLHRRRRRPASRHARDRARARPWPLREARRASRGAGLRRRGARRELRAGPAARGTRRGAAARAVQHAGRVVSRSARLERYRHRPGRYAACPICAAPARPPTRRSSAWSPLPKAAPRVRSRRRRRCSGRACTHRV